MIIRRIHDQADQLAILSEDLSTIETIILADHLGGFDKELRHPVLDVLLQRHCKSSILIPYFIDSRLKKNYQELDIRVNLPQQLNAVFPHFVDYRQHPVVKHQNFICSFNGSPHVSRKLLVSALDKFGWFAADYSSKNFQFSADNIDGHILDHMPENEAHIYSKFFSKREDFCQKIYSFGHDRFEHKNNIKRLENKITQSFVNLVSESLADTYYPFISEKFLYSVTTRGLFLTWAQPGWHLHLENFFGFKRYNKIFDYQFDSIKNPIHRLISLMCMLSKFSTLSRDDWRDLYEVEKDTLEFNYDHYFSKSYLKSIEQAI